MAPMLSFFVLFLHFPLLLSISSLAIVRPFAVVDTAKLVLSFQAWGTYLPCPAPLAVQVDLFLCFSQNLSENTEALVATSTLVAEFSTHQSHLKDWTWPRCFRNIFAISANLTPEEDIYIPFDAGNRSDWVKGPNLQYLAIAEGFENKQWGQYDAWFLMEMDCVARRAGWLAELLAEVAQRAPFAVLGSFYRGDQWDKLDMPPAIHQHINGNAVYNHSNPLVRQIVATLRAEAVDGNWSQAFDVLGAAVYLNSTLTAQQFGWYAGDSRVIGNYAHTPMLEAYYAGEALVHGGWLYGEWNASDGEVTLVVSDYGRWATEEAWTELETFEASLLRGHHPFRHVVAVRPPENVTAAPYYGGSGPDTVAFQQVPRNGSVWLDWCAAPVPTPWFLYTNVFFDFRRRVDILRTTDTHQPVATYLPAGSSYCLDSDVCTYHLNRAKQFAGVSPIGHVDLTQLLFRTAERDAFCAAWQRWRAATPAPDCDPVPGPTADDYAAYLLAVNRSGIYDWEDVLRRGQRSRGVQRTFPADTRPCAFPSVASNASLCDMMSDESTCEAIAGCSWRPFFEVCFLGSLPAIPPVPALAFYRQYPPVDSTGLAAPEVEVENPNAIPITLQLLSAAGTPSWAATLPPGGNRSLPPAGTAAAPQHVAAEVWQQTVTLVVTSSAPRLLHPEALLLFDVRRWVVNATPVLSCQGTPLVLSAAIPTNVLQLQPVAGITFLSPVVASGGWMRCADSVSPNVMVLDTSRLPGAMAELTLQALQVGQLAGWLVAARSTVTVEVAPACSVPCDGVLFLNESMVPSGAPVSVTLLSNVTAANFTWRVGPGVPLVTHRRTAVLLAPFVATSQAVVVQVATQDTYGRTATCAAVLTVAPADPAVALAAAAECANGTTTASAAGQCLGAVAALLALGGGAEAVGALTAALAGVARTLAPADPAQSNAVLGQLADLAQADSLLSAADQLALQTALIGVLDRLVASAPIDSSSASPLLSLLGPLLESSVASTAATAVASRRRAASSNASDPGAAQQLTDLFDAAMLRVAGSEVTPYAMGEASSPNDCINASWGLRTAASLAGNYSAVTLLPAAAQLFPAWVRLLMASVSPACNALRDELQSSTGLRRLLFLNASIGAVIPAEEIQRRNNHSVSLWQTTFLVDAVPASAQERKFRPLAAQPAGQLTCISTDPTTGQPVSFPAAGGQCAMSAPGSVSAKFVYTAPSPSPSPMDNSTDANFTAAGLAAEPGGWPGWAFLAICLSVFCLLVLCLALCLALWWRRRPVVADPTPPTEVPEPLASPLPQQPGSLKTTWRSTKRAWEDTGQDGGSPTRSALPSRCAGRPTSAKYTVGSRRTRSGSLCSLPVHPELEEDSAECASSDVCHARLSLPLPSLPSSASLREVDSLPVLTARSDLDPDLDDGRVPGHPMSDRPPAPRLGGCRGPLPGGRPTSAISLCSVSTIDWDDSDCCSCCDEPRHARPSHSRGTNRSPPTPGEAAVPPSGGRGDSCQLAGESCQPTRRASSAAGHSRPLATPTPAERNPLRTLRGSASHAAPPRRSPRSPSRLVGVFLFGTPPQAPD